MGRYGGLLRSPAVLFSCSPVQNLPGFMLVLRAAGFCLSPYAVSLSPGLGCSREHHNWNCSGTVSTWPLGGAVAFSLLLGKPLTLPTAPRFTFCIWALHYAPLPVLGQSSLRKVRLKTAAEVCDNMGCSYPGHRDTATRVDLMSRFMFRETSVVPRHAVPDQSSP